jgi:hypothetical protein
VPNKAAGERPLSHGYRVTVPRRSEPTIGAFSSAPASRPNVNRIPAWYAALHERKSASVGDSRIVELSRSGVERAANSEVSAHPNHPSTIEVKSTPTSENSLPLEAPVSCCSQHHQRGRPLRWGCRGHRVLVPSTFRSCVCFPCPTTSKSLPRNARGYRQVEAGGGIKCAKL